MNERIKLLAEQAETKEIGYYFFDREKFAELIVLETLDQVNKNMELTWVDGEVKIKQHFGVK